MPIQQASRPGIPVWTYRPPLNRTPHIARRDQARVLSASPLEYRSLLLPAMAEGTSFRNLFVGALPKTVTCGDQQALPVGETLMFSPVDWRGETVA